MHNTMHHFRTSTVLHMYDDGNIDRLNVLLGKQNSLEALEPIGKQNGSSEAVWLVHVPFALNLTTYLDAFEPRRTIESYLADIFTRTPLRLDSNVYAFFQVGNPGSLNQYINC